jgi:hypothetical protein
MLTKSNPRNYRFALQAVVTGTAQVSTTSTLKVAAGDAAADDDYNQRLAVITVQGTGGPPVGQRAIITNYDSATKVATIRCLDTADGKWTAAPAADTQYAIHPVLRDEPFIGSAQAAGATLFTITLSDDESKQDDYYAGLDIELVAGTGARPGQKNRIVNYVGSSRLATVSGPFNAIPDATTRYRIQGHLYHPVSAVLVAETSGAAVLRFATNPAGLALGAYSKGTQIDEDKVGGMAYLELAMDGAASTVEITRWE